MRARSIAAVFVAVLLVGSLASCTKKDSGSDDASDVKTEESDQSTVTTVPDEPSDDTPPSGNAPDCQAARAAYQQLLTSGGALVGGADQAQIDELQDALDMARADLPDSLKDDFETVADAYNEFVEAMADGKSFMDREMQDAVQNLDSDEVKAASDNIEEYFDSCDT